jgi:hypothetical protein
LLHAIEKGALLRAGRRRRRNTGGVTDYRQFYDIPVEISRWALVVETWGRPITLFTYPATGEPLVF